MIFLCQKLVMIDPQRTQIAKRLLSTNQTPWSISTYLTFSKIKGSNNQSRFLTYSTKESADILSAHSLILISVYQKCN